ncbi:helix-turn-helix transcriptional regulator [Clostridium sp. C8-1-8]|uniref:helix-turn-helix domain-containing protein n=1 Tax=Clostridium sp. C8-1-8 TaxID=2698831 RepID=UPI0013721190|nr:helix-turn-helix transcriptional regulator [Clostridium sp. C8-1-8]
MKHQRITKGLSIRKLAEIAELNPVTIQKIESQSSRPNPSTAKKICNALEVDFDEIFTIAK